MSESNFKIMCLIHALTQYYCWPSGDEIWPKGEGKKCFNNFDKFIKLKTQLLFNSNKVYHKSNISTKNKKLFLTWSL